MSNVEPNIAVASGPYKDTSGLALMEYYAMGYKKGVLEANRAKEQRALWHGKWALVKHENNQLRKKLSLFEAVKEERVLREEIKDLKANYIILRGHLKTLREEVSRVDSLLSSTEGFIDS